MSEIFLDTETTGLSYKDGHKIVEIACIETKDLIPTNNVFHKLINPKRNVPEAAFSVHGFSEDFLSKKETFDKISDEFSDNVVIGKVNVDEVKEVPVKYGIRSIPTLLFFNHGEIVRQEVGLQSEQALVDNINQVMKKS